MKIPRPLLESLAPRLQKAITNRVDHLPEQGSPVCGVRIMYKGSSVEQQEGEKPTNIHRFDVKLLFEDGDWILL